MAEKIVGFIALTESAIVDDPMPSDLLAEGTPKIVKVIQYERNKRARQRCLARWGCRCAVCDMSFEEVYGPGFKDYIHVHHLESIALRKATYRLNPERDLRPLCPNCHAVTHRSDPPYSVVEIKRFLTQ